MSKVFTRNYLAMAVLFIAMLVLLSGISPCAAAIVPTGNVEPLGTWTSSTYGYVGNTSNGSLSVDARSLLQSYRAYIAYSSGVSGTATVTGAGSKWTNRDSLYVGHFGNGTLSVKAGGQVSSTGGFLGYNAGSQGMATITGAGSMWTTGSGSLYVGNSGSGTLNIEAGGVVNNDSGFLGYNAGSTGTVTVTGTGSKWTNSNSLYVGRDGSGTLNIEAGGQVSNTMGYIGFDSGSSGIATITAAGSKWTNSSSLYIGNNGSGILRIEAGGQVSSSTGYLGYCAGSMGTATISGTGSKWTNSGDLYIGKDGTGTLTVSDGGAVTAGTLFASLSSLSGNGTITTTQGAVLDANFRFDTAHSAQATFVFDSGGTLTVSAAGTLGAGYKESGSLTIVEGVAISSSTGYLGYCADSMGTATISGTGSKWTNSGDLYIGKDGTGTLTVADGGSVTAGTLFASLSSLLGNGTITTTKGAVLDANFRFDTAHSAQATFVFDSGGTLTVSAAGTLGAGYKESGSLTIAEGVAISSSTGYLGYCVGSMGTATISGTGSKWTNSNSLYVGRDGSGTLNIEAGGEVSGSSNGNLGYNAGSQGMATITGAGSKWTTGSGSLYVGSSGNGTMNIEAGGQVSSTGGFLGYNAGSQGMATITGAGSKWTTGSGSLYVGNSGRGTLNIEAGGQVSNDIGYLGYVTGSSGSATVTGTGSKWINSNSLYVGREGSGTLNIAAGGQVSNTSGSLGNNAGSSGSATVTGTGSEWTNSSSLYIGNYGSGTLRIEAGGQVSNTMGYIGSASGSSGIATVTGTGSKWTINGWGFNVGYYGKGTLCIEAGGQVSDSSAFIGESADAFGTATVTGAGSKWTNRNYLFVGHNGSGTLTVTDGAEVTAGTLFASMESLYGNGTITAQGAVLDANLRFDAAHPSQTILAFGSGGTLTINVNAARGDLGAGYKGSGSLIVAEGAVANSFWGYLGYHAGSSGSATVTGTGSEWTNSGNLFVGVDGSGTLHIEAGGQVSNAIGYLGYVTGSSGSATVTGTGSEWINSSSLSVGSTGKGTLHIRDGGAVTAISISVNSSSLLTLDTSHGSKLTVGSGTGTITNSGKIRVLAGPQPDAGNQYSPIAAGTWSGSGTYQAVGGTWNDMSHVFTVSQMLRGVSDVPVAIDRLSTQRILIDDGASGWELGASFLSADTSTPLTFMATAISDGTLDKLSGMLLADEKLLGGWNLAANSGYTAGDPLYLSFGDGTGGSFTSEEMKVWSYDGTKWAELAVSDLTFDGNYASFTANLGCYAVSVPVPEPGMVTLLALGLLGMAVIKWRRNRK
jgi:T5SS/PEP-CTERM-associated repeat protein